MFGILKAINTVADIVKVGVSVAKKIKQYQQAMETAKVLKDQNDKETEKQLQDLLDN